MDQGTPVSRSKLELAYLVLALGETLGQTPKTTHHLRVLHNTTSPTMTTGISPSRMHPPKHPTMPRLLTTPKNDENLSYYGIESAAEVPREDDSEAVESS
jgi:hypothetical protein